MSDPKEFIVSNHHLRNSKWTLGYGTLGLIMSDPKDPITEPQMVSKGCMITSFERYLGSITKVIGSLGRDKLIDVRLLGAVAKDL